VRSSPANVPSDRNPAYLCQHTPLMSDIHTGRRFHSESTLQDIEIGKISPISMST
jgi:hypothetical protein